MPISLYKNIEDNLKELSDIELQKKIWFDPNNDIGWISSYTELKEMFFSDSTYYVVNCKFRELNVNKELKNEFKKLIKLFDEYIEPKEYLKFNDDNIIIRDIKWLDITKQAQKVRELWDKEDKIPREE